MEIEEKDSVTDFLKLMNRINYFTKLTPDEKKEDLFTLELKVSGYKDVSSMVSDLLKVSILALESDPPYISRAIRNPEINVLGLLEIALQLMPHGELELLDELHQFYLKQREQ
ncbi:hypothetical protein [Flavobacterium sp. XS2P39]|uniref:hypothetical protein n=1 Tax=Flavobacterium sp. XS2P39 TaxID=3401725 RepID=UPI003AAFD085